MKQLIKIPLTITGILMIAAVPAGALPGLADKKDNIQRYGTNDLTVINTKVRYTTIIQLPEGESIEEILCGDKDYWVIEGRKSFVYVKPSKEGAETNVTVVSQNSGVYSFLVREISKLPNAKPDMRVVLGAEEWTTLRKQRDKLADLVSEEERKAKDLKENANSVLEEPGGLQSKKKDTTDNTSGQNHAPQPDKTVADQDSPVTSAPHQAHKEEPKATAIDAAVASPTDPVIAQSRAFAFRDEGFIRKAGRAMGHFFRGVSQALHLY